MTLRARPAQQPCSASWQYLRGPGVVPVIEVVGGVIAGYILQLGAADSVLYVFRTRNCYEEALFGQ